MSAFGRRMGTDLVYADIPACGDLAASEMRVRLAPPVIPKAIPGGYREISDH
jgi:hypothetical protein